MDRKELQAGMQLVRSKCIPLNQHPLFQKKASKQGEFNALPQQPNPKKSLLSFPVKSPMESLRQRTQESLRGLQSKAERINQLSAELETAVLELKAIAQEVNRDWRAIQATQEPITGASKKRNAIASFVPDVCQYQAIYVPIVHQKQSGELVLTSRTVDLFQAEREATLLAQTLRRRAKRKRLTTESNQLT